MTAADLPGLTMPTGSWAPRPTGRSVVQARADRQRYQAETARVMRSFPELQLRVYAIQLGVKLEAVLWLPARDGGYPTTLVVEEALWQPPAVTPEALVQWGQRALSAWLARRLEATEAPAEA